jgi:RIO-like serine/threonine protein kinase
MMTAEMGEDVGDLELLSTVANADAAVVPTAEITDRISIDEDEVHDRLDQLAENGLLSARDRGWVLKLPGRITLKREWPGNP